MRLSQRASGVLERIRRLRRSMLGGLQSFLPLYLFGNNEPGAWYDADDLTDAKLAYRRNLLTWTENLAKSNAIWEHDGTLAVTANYSVAPDGTTTATRVNYTSGTPCYIFQDVPSKARTTYTLSFYIKAAIPQSCRLNLQQMGEGNNFSTVNATTDWVRYTVSGTTIAAVTLRCTITSLSDNSLFDVQVWGAMLALSTVDQTYQKVTDWNTEFLAAFPSHALYQDSAGTLAVKTLEDPLGKVLDKSGRGNHLIQPTSGNRPTWTRRVNILNATATLSTQTATTIAAQYKLSFTGAGSIALSGTATGTITAGTTLVTCTAGTLTLTVTGAVTLADMRLSSDVATPTYQAVRSATDYDYVGFPSKIKHNGTNSFLYTASTMNLSATDKVTVFAGVQKLGSTQQFIAEIGPATESNNGSFAVYADDRASKTYAFWTRGTTGIFPFTGSYTPPITNVYSAQSSISTPSVKIRINGVQDGTSTASQGTGNYGNYVMTVGARTGPVFPFSGSWTQLIIRGALTSDAQVAQAETYVRNKTLAYPYYGYYGYPGQIGIDWTVGVSTLS